MQQFIKSENSRRDLGLDLVRFLSFIAIVFHHYHYVMWYTVDIDVSKYFWGWQIIEAYSRSIAFSGHTILFLSAFLIARAESTFFKTYKVILWSILGWFIFCLFEWSPNHAFWFWDIYPLIAAGLMTAVVLKKGTIKWFSKSAILLSVLGFFTLWIPFWTWPSLQVQSLFWRSWLIGDCQTDFADWPLLPWIGIVWMGYGLGSYAHQYKKENQQNWLKLWGKKEFIFWIPILVLCLPNMNTFYRIQFGPYFSCFSFRQEPWMFWSSFIPVLFVLRLCLLESTQNFLQKFKIVHFISRLKISTHFGVIYLLHYTVVEATKYFKFRVDGADAVLSFLVYLAIIPITEILARILIRGFLFFVPKR